MAPLGMGASATAVRPVLGVGAGAGAIAVAAVAVAAVAELQESSGLGEVECCAQSGYTENWPADGPQLRGEVDVAETSYTVKQAPAVGARRRGQTGCLPPVQMAPSVLVFPRVRDAVGGTPQQGQPLLDPPNHQSQGSQ